MRTTLNLDDDLVMEAKIVAVRTRRTLSAVIEDALRKEVARASAGAERRPSRPSTPLNLPTWDGGGFPEGVDIDCNASLLDFMERQPSEAR